MDLAAREITADWNMDNIINWNRQPVFSSEVIDYKTVSNATTATRVGIDVTSLAQEWYAGTKQNNGVAIFPVTEYSSSTASYTQCNASFASANWSGDIQPIFMVQYRDTKGIEDYWTYQTQDFGEIGTGYVSDFTSGLTFVHSDMDSTGNVLPVNLGHVFNSYMEGKEFTSANYLTADFSAMRVGRGWKFSLQETVVSTTISGVNYYVHNDSDGTEHYYLDSNSDGIYESEDGLKFTIVKNSNGSFTMKDEYGGVKEFDSSGRMVQLRDVNGNKKLFNYSGGRLVSVQEQNAGASAVNIFTFNYVNNILSEIVDAQDPADKITFYYNKGYYDFHAEYSGSQLNNFSSSDTLCLVRIQHSKGADVSYQYGTKDDLGGIYDLKTYRHIIYFHRDVGSIDGKVDSFKEHGYTGSASGGISNLDPSKIINGSKVTIQSRGQKTTTYRHSGRDDTYGNSDDLLETYIFDHYGRTICSYISDLNGQTIYKARSAAYEDGNTSSTFKARHSVTQTAQTGGWASSGNVSANNLLQNGDFTSTSSWSGATVSGGQLVVSGNHKGTKSVSQTVTVNASADQTYTLSGWAKALSVPKLETGNNRKYELRALITYTDGTTETQTVEFNVDSSQWQYACGGIAPKQSGKTVRSITVSCAFDYQPNTAYFDKVRLVKDPSPTYRYDANGKLVSMTKEDGTQQALVYTGADLTKESMPNGDEYTYTYKKDSSGNSTHQVASIADKNGATASYQYDAYGNITQAAVQASGLASTVSASGTYSNNGKYLSTVTDAMGNTVHYQFDTVTGLKKYVEDPMGNRVAYQYNDTEYISNVWTDTNKNGLADRNEAKVTYEYSHGRLDTVQTPKTSYHYQYDAYENLSSIGAGSASGASSYTLRSYAYGPENGKLNSITMGNGTVIGYQYDVLNRIQTISYNGQAKYQYTYNDDNQLSQVKDTVNQITTSYVYDRIGRLSSASTSYPTLGSIGAASVGIAYQYDGAGRLQSRNYTVGSTAQNYSASYRTNSNLITTFTMPGANIQYSYDALQRMTDQKVISGSKVLGGQSYAYQSGKSTNSTSTIINQVTMDVTGTKYQYVYDANGNITQVKKNGTVIKTYTYDERNQLTSETFDGYKLYYGYDLAGNLDYVDKEIGGVRRNLQTYGYASNWGDLMTYYGTNQITYDNAGNPLTYGNGQDYTFTWSEGNLLTGANVEGIAVTYVYSEGGVRISKTVGGKNTRFYLDGSRILRENRNGTVIDYYYDDQGNAIGFQYNGSTYYYGRNLQGDVVELYQNGALVGKYEYDAWGAIESITDASGNAITSASNAAMVNPFRYRGYYYDEETGFYYLNSRYYDPVVKRFINADTTEYLGVNGSILGYNLYLYCGNDPINRIDVTGYSWLDDAWNWIQNGASIVYKWIEEAYLYITNTSEKVVINAKFIAFYKGRLVIKHPFSGNMSFGVIFLENGLKVNDQGIMTVQHEYGHTLQLDELGIFDYISKVAIPSITANILQREGNLQYDYYSSPWEYEADLYGGVEGRYYESWAGNSYAAWKGKRRGGNGGFKVDYVLH